MMDQTEHGMLQATQHSNNVNINYTDTSSGHHSDASGNCGNLRPIENGGNSIGESAWGEKCLEENRESVLQHNRHPLHNSSGSGGVNLFGASSSSTGFPQHNHYPSQQEHYFPSNHHYNNNNNCATPQLRSADSLSTYSSSASSSSYYPVVGGDRECRQFYTNQHQMDHLGYSFDHHQNNSSKNTNTHALQGNNNFYGYYNHNQNSHFSNVYQSQMPQNTGLSITGTDEAGAPAFISRSHDQRYFDPSHHHHHHSNNDRHPENNMQQDYYPSSSPNYGSQQSNRYNNSNSGVHHSHYHGHHVPFRRKSMESFISSEPGDLRYNSTTKYNFPFPQPPPAAQPTQSPYCSPTSSTTSIMIKRECSSNPSSSSIGPSQVIPGPNSTTTTNSNSCSEWSPRNNSNCSAANHNTHNNDSCNPHQDYFRTTQTAPDSSMNYNISYPQQQQQQSDNSNSTGISNYHGQEVSFRSCAFEEQHNDTEEQDKYGANANNNASVDSQQHNSSVTSCHLSADDQNTQQPMDNEEASFDSATEDGGSENVDTKDNMFSHQDFHKENENKLKSLDHDDDNTRDSANDDNVPCDGIDDAEIDSSSLLLDSSAFDDIPESDMIIAEKSFDEDVKDSLTLQTSNDSKDDPEEELKKTQSPTSDANAISTTTLESICSLSRRKTTNNNTRAPCDADSESNSYNSNCSFTSELYAIKRSTSVCNFGSSESASDDNNECPTTSFRFNDGGHSTVKYNNHPQKISKRSYSETDKDRNKSANLPHHDDLLLGMDIPRRSNCNQNQSSKITSGAVRVPKGWKREISFVKELFTVYYISPSETKLKSWDELKNYICSDGTCKCGLSCPLRLENAFSFDPKVVNLCVNPKRVKSEDNLMYLTGFKEEEEEQLSECSQQEDTKLCNHFKRKIPKSEDSPIISSTRDDLGDCPGIKKRRPNDSLCENYVGNGKGFECHVPSSTIAVPCSQQSPDTTTQTPQSEMSPSDSIYGSSCKKSSVRATPTPPSNANVRNTRLPSKEQENGSDIMLVDVQAKNTSSSSSSSSSTETEKLAKNVNIIEKKEIESKEDEDEKKKKDDVKNLAPADSSCANKSSAVVGAKKESKEQNFSTISVDFKAKQPMAECDKRESSNNTSTLNSQSTIETTTTATVTNMGAGVATTAGVNTFTVPTFMGQLILQAPQPNNGSDASVQGNNILSTGGGGQSMRYPLIQTIQPSFFLNSTGGGNNAPLIISPQTTHQGDGITQSFIYHDPQNTSSDHSSSIQSMLQAGTTMLFDPNAVCGANLGLLPPPGKRKKKRLSKRQQQQQAQIQLQQQLLIQQIQQAQQQQQVAASFPLTIFPQQTFNFQGSNGFNLQPMNFFQAPTILTLPNLILNPADGTLFLQPQAPLTTTLQQSTTTTTGPVKFPISSASSITTSQIPQHPNPIAPKRELNNSSSSSSNDTGNVTIMDTVSDDLRRNNPTPDSSTGDIQLGILNPSTTSPSTANNIINISPQITPNTTTTIIPKLMKKSSLKNRTVSSTVKRIFPQKQILPKIDSTTPSIENT